jgi:LmbE family N-acetylglucosaminyl deacetylase
MKLLNFNKILCLSPHPDDVEYSMAGTILKYNDTHFDILCLTQGGDCDSTTNISRLNEVRDVWVKSKSNNVSLYFTEYKLLKELGEDEWVSYIEREYILKNNYDCILTPSQYDSHFEHKIVCNLGYALTRISPISLIEYYSPSTLETWVPNVFIDITDQYNTKLKMLQMFKSQLHRSYFNENTLKEFHTNFRCSKRNIKLIEQFKFKQIFL